MRAIHLAAALAATLASGAAQAEGLAVSPGLWEIGPAGASAQAPVAMPQIPADQLAKLTPEQQAMLQQRMASAGAPKRVVRKICVTQKMIDTGFNGGDSASCTRTVVSSSSSRMEIGMVCTGAHPATGTMRLEAADAQTVTGTTDLQITNPGGATMPMHRAFQGHWLGADCGDIKPRE